MNDNNNTNTEPLYYDLKEVEDILKVTNRTLLTYIKNGRLKATKIGRRYTVTPAALKDLLNNK